jgi:hypothetical protein
MPGSFLGVVPAREAEPAFLFVGNEKGMKRIAEAARRAVHEGNEMERNRDSQQDGWPFRQYQDQ